VKDAYLELYQEKGSGDYLIQRYAGSYGVGRFIRVSREEMEERGLEIVLMHLRVQPLSEPSEKPELSAFTKEESRAFYRRTRHVFVCLASDGTISTGPLHRKGSGFVAPREEVVRLAEHRTNREFLEALRNVYSALS
jgi:hypothetical protein